MYTSISELQELIDILKEHGIVHELVDINEKTPINSRIPLTIAEVRHDTNGILVFERGHTTGFKWRKQEPWNHSRSERIKASWLEEVEDDEVAGIVDAAIC
jgi:hypothetical protein